MNTLQKPALALQNKEVPRTCFLCGATHHPLTERARLNSPETNQSLPC